MNRAGGTNKYERKENVYETVVAMIDFKAQLGGTAKKDGKRSLSCRSFIYQVFTDH